MITNTYFIYNKIKILVATVIEYTLPLKFNLKSDITSR